MKLNNADRDFLFELLNLPTAPFREHAVLTLCSQYLAQNRVPHFSDAIGNIVVGARNLAEYRRKFSQKSAEPLRLVIAHTDHPGFHGARWLTKDRLKFTWHGGSPTKYLTGAPVWIAERGTSIKHAAVITSAKLQPRKHALKEGVLKIARPWWSSAKTRPQAQDLFGAFRFRKSVWAQGDKVYTGGADDIVGVFTILQTAKALWKKPNASQHHFLALLSRAEEVGFIGTIGHFEKVLPERRAREVLVLSLEASRTLSGAVIGLGPVVRLGDRSSVFDSRYSAALHQCAQKILKTKFQRRLMDGGSCEATAAIAYGLKAVGISVPLGNYHNMCFEGGPDSRGALGPAPEFVHTQDIAGQVALCLGLMKMNLSSNINIFAAQQARLRRGFKDAARLLQ